MRSPGKFSSAENDGWLERVNEATRQLGTYRHMLVFSTAILAYTSQIALMCWRDRECSSIYSHLYPPFRMDDLVS